ncbi:MAG: SDR family oxidoreductase [Pseudomonadota bacterium]
MHFAGKVAVVTGGASGIGEATARLLRDQGATVYITDVQYERGEMLAEQIGAHFVAHNVTSERAWGDLLEQVTGTDGRLDVLINNAGIFRPGTIEELTLQSLQEVLDVNLVGTALGCREAVRAMKANPEGPQGAIVNVSSIAGIVGFAAGAAYSASKGAVRLLTKAVAVHCAREYRTIRCNSVHPGVIDTPMNQATFEAADDPAAVRDTFAHMQPIGRMVEPEEVAQAIAYLASDSSMAVSGTEIVVDGAWLATANGL